MCPMEKRFGFGDYERADVDVRTSTLELRKLFLNTLVFRKRDWAKALVRIANFNLLSEPIRKDFTEKDIFCFSLPHVFGANPLGVNLTNHAKIFYGKD